MRPTVPARPVMTMVFVSTLLLLVVLAAPPAGGQEIVWENRGQPEFGGDAVDIDGGEGVVVASGIVDDEFFNSQWFVRAVDLRTGATKWEDRFGPVLFGLAKDVAVHGRRAFVAGWILNPEGGFVFVVRAYALHSGTLLWSLEMGRGPRCGEEAPGFARCIAKALDVQGDRVFVVGHLTRTAARSDFAVVALDAATGARLWESVIDPTGTGANDYAWAVKAKGDHLFVLGEVGDGSALLLRAHDAKTGAVRWQQQLAGARNFTLKDTLAAGGDRVFIAGTDANGHFMVQAYDASSGSLRWADRVDDGDRVGEAEALSFEDDGSEGRLFATGVVGCNPVTFVECQLAVRAYDPGRGLLWHRADQARGGDWGFPLQIAAGVGRVFVGGGELLEDGQYHGTVRAYRARDGALAWEDQFDAGGDPFGFLDTLAVVDGRLLAGGEIFRSPDGSGDFVLRRYDAR
jgi:outer membrane protein assembly factor BamB